MINVEKKTFLYGAVIKLTREDTLEDIERNFKKMSEAGLDTAVVWPSAFWWEEKKDGYPFNTGRRVLEIAERTGIKVIMELAGQLPMMEYIPDFQMKDEYYCVDENGHKRLSHNSFGWLNYFHPEVDALICDHFKKTAAAYKDSPALVAYDVFNETAFNSYDTYTLERFRLWLREKYGTVERLNDVWEHNYTDFSQIGFAPWMWMSIMPAADFGAFRRESVAIFLKGWCAAVKSVDTRHPLIADNIGSMITNGVGMYERPQDDFSLSTAADEIGMSFYPKQVTGCRSSGNRWATFDAFNAAAGHNGFYVSEMQTHVQAMFNPSTAVRPYELKQWCYESIAAGAKGLIYWMWRPFTKGLQTAGRGLIDYKERSTPRLTFASELSKTVSETGTLTPSKSKVGILFDPLCLDFQVLYTKCYRVDQNIYLSSICGAYNSFLNAGVRADFVTLKEISGYKAIILSNHIVIGRETAKALGEYVKGGGTVICDGRTGLVDEQGMLGETLPGGEFNSFMGHEFVDSDYENMRFDFNGKAYCGYYGKEVASVTDGEAIAFFEDGSPAIIKKRTGKGEVITVNTYLWYSYGSEGSAAVEIASLLSGDYGLRTLNVSAPLRVRTAENGEYRYAFIFNYTDKDVSGHISGDGFDTDVTVKAYDVILKRIKK